VADALDADEAKLVRGLDAALHGPMGVTGSALDLAHVGLSGELVQDAGDFGQSAVLFRGEFVPEVAECVDSGA
jgi:hypothetical protein